MYELLLKMKSRFKELSWLKMVDQAWEKGKITDEEYTTLTGKEIVEEEVVEEVEVYADEVEETDTNETTDEIE